MPYRLRKVPKKDLYWVVGEDGRHHSKEGLPLERAKKQMAALYVAMRKEGGSIDPTINAAYNTRKPMTEEAWIKNRAIWDPANATHDNYIRMYLEPFNRYNQTAGTVFVKGVDKAMTCPPDALIIQDGQQKNLPPGTKYCIENPDTGSIVQGTTKTKSELDYYAKEEADRRKAAEDAYWKRQGAVSTFFNRDVTGALTSLADEFVDKVPVVGQYLAPVYKAFAPPGSEFHTKGSFGEKLGNAVLGEVQAVAKAQGPAILNSIKRQAGFGHLHDYKGSGVIDDIKKGATIVYERVRAVAKGPRMDFRPSIRSLLATIGDQPIRQVIVRREPLSTLVRAGIDFLSEGGLTKAAKLGGYDHFFHLSLEVFVGPNEVGYVLEKNEVINIAPAKPVTPLTQKMRVDISNMTYNTLNPWLDAAKKKMGSRFFPYSPLQNNCQDFVLGLIYSNDLSTPAIANFVKQNMSQCIQTLPPSVQMLMKGVTDTAAVANVALEGEGHLNHPRAAFEAQFHRWKVTPADYLIEARRKAKKAGLKSEWLGFSNDDKHKLQIAIPNGKVVRFGSVGLGDHILYEMSGDKSADRHRKSYLARATKIHGDWEKNAYSPNNLAIKVLW
jgi:hypothetical protein